nr:MAG TPA: hypothetical protein [Bacteriophage sp.]
MTTGGYKGYNVFIIPFLRIGSDMIERNEKS